MNRPIASALLAMCLVTAGCSSSKPDPEPAPKPIGRAPVAQPREEPAAQAEPSTPPPRQAEPARTPQGQGWKKVVWLNGFGRAEGDRIWRAMEQSGEFSEVMDGGGGNDQRIPLECKYHGEDLKRTLNQMLRDLELRHHFTEAHLKHHIEVHRDR